MRPGHISKPGDWKKFPKHVIAEGTRVEMEHTSSPTRARRIAVDHLVELGTKYYPELAKMEKRLRRMRK